jgi:hypothetical protein
VGILGRRTLASRGALWRKDWSVKPAGQAWLDLVRKQWWTTAEGTSAANGTFTVRGFLGDYTLTVTSSGRTQTAHATLSADGGDVRVVLK